jgi:hypothetical protein
MPCFTGWFQVLKVDNFMPEFCTLVSESLGSASTKMHIRISMFFKFTNSHQQFLQLKNAADIGLPDAGLPEVGLEVGLPNVENLLRSKNGKMEKNTNYQLLPQYHAWTQS